MLSNVYCNVILGYSDLCWRIENKFLEYSFWLTQLTRRNEQCLGLLRSACWSGGGFRMVCGHPRLCQAWIARLCGSAFSKFPCVSALSSSVKHRRLLGRGLDALCHILMVRGMLRELVLGRLLAESVGWPGERCFCMHQSEFLSKTRINMWNKISRL